MSGLDSRFRQKRKICVCWPWLTMIVCFRAILEINFCGKGQDLVKQSTKSSFLEQLILLLRKQLTHYCALTVVWTEKSSEDKVFSQGDTSQNKQKNDYYR